MMLWSCGASPSLLACCVPLCSGRQPLWCISCSAWMNSSNCLLSIGIIDSLPGSRISPGISQQKGVYNREPENGKVTMPFIDDRYGKQKKEDGCYGSRRFSDPEREDCQREAFHGYD